MYDFSQVTEVRLSSGSHTSAAEGMCFMEMTAWFAGEVHSDKPACACPVLGAYGIALNDNMSDALRDRLLKPLVPLIAGTRGTLQDQLKRSEFLAMWAVNKVAPIALRAAGLDAQAQTCEAATDLGSAKAAAKAEAAAAAAAWSAEAAKAAAAWSAEAAAWSAAVASGPTPSSRAVSAMLARSVCIVRGCMAA